MLRSDEEIIRLLQGQKSSLICCGHTHIARAISLSIGQLVVYPGSVGLQAYIDEEPSFHAMENFTQHASIQLSKSAMLTVDACKQRHQAALKNLNQPLFFSVLFTVM